MKGKDHRKPFRFKDRGRRIGSGDLSSYDPRAVQIAHLRLAILKAFYSHREDLNRTGGLKTKTQAVREFVDLYNFGMILPQTLRKPEHLSRSCLYGWDAAYRKGGLRSLIPRYSWKSKSGATLAFLKLFPKYTKITIPGPPKRTAKSDVLSHIIRQWKAAPLDGPLVLGILYSVGIRKGTQMKRRMRMLKHHVSPMTKPSLDSLNAFVVDCLTGLVFENHSQIVEFHCKKKFEWQPKTEILIRPLLG